MERIFADFTAQVFAFIRFDLSNQRHPRSISVKFGPWSSFRPTCADWAKSARVGVATVVASWQVCRANRYGPADSQTG